MLRSQDRGGHRQPEPIVLTKEPEARDDLEWDRDQDEKKRASMTFFVVVLSSPWSAS